MIGVSWAGMTELDGIVVRVVGTRSEGMLLVVVVVDGVVVDVVVVDVVVVGLVLMSFSSVDVKLCGKWLDSRLLLG